MALILIVDDSPNQTSALRKILERQGHDVVEASNGDDGVSSALEYQPDLIFMDVVMPGLNGFQATKKIYGNPATSHIPIIMIVGEDQETDATWGINAGARSALFRPLNEETLLSEMAALGIT